MQSEQMLTRFNAAQRVAISERRQVVVSCMKLHNDSESRPQISSDWEETKQMPDFVLAAPKGVRVQLLS